CASMSGPYDLRDATGFVADFLPDKSRRTEASPVLTIQPNPPPTVISVGSTETPFLATSREFADKVKASGGVAELIVLQGMTHDQTALAAADDTGPLFAAIVRMIDTRSRKARSKSS